MSKNLRQVSRKARAPFSLPQGVNLGTDRRGITPEKVFSVMDDEVEGTTSGQLKATGHTQTERCTSLTERGRTEVVTGETPVPKYILAVKPLDPKRRGCTKMHFID